MKTQRLFQIIYILLNKESVTAQELSEKFEVSIRTIYRDIDTLSTAGIPIYTTQGKGGGISLLDNFILDKSMLSDREQNEIIFALQGLNVTNNNEMEDVLFKLENFFNKNIHDWIEVDFSSWGSSANKKNDFSIIKDAILDARLIKFDYLNSLGEKNERIVEPTKLIFKVHSWYLKAFCLNKNDYRTFKLARIYNLSVTKEIFSPRHPKGKSIKKDNDSNLGWIEIKLKFAPQASYRVFDEFKIDNIEKNDDESLTVLTYLPDNNWLLGYLLSFGSTVEVVSPRSIRLKIMGELDEIKKKILLVPYNLTYSSQVMFSIFLID